jgi:small redox-active disulfide protein 2
VKREIETVSNNQTESMKILVIGPGCAKCKTLAQFTEQAVKELGLMAEINKVTDIKQIIALGVMLTPALAVNGTVKVVGRVPSIPEIKAMLQEAAA